MVHHLRWGFTQKKSGGDGDPHRGVLGWRRWMEDGEAQVSTFSDGDGDLRGTTLDVVGQNERGEECRWPTSGWWRLGSVTSGAATKGANLGFKLSREEIWDHTTTIYRVFCSRISHTDRTLSSSQIRFEIALIPFEFVGEKISFRMSFVLDHR
jgi:hypothetical protein